MWRITVLAGGFSGSQQTGNTARHTGRAANRCQQSNSEMPVDTSAHLFMVQMTFTANDTRPIASRDFLARLATNVALQPPYWVTGVTI